MMGVETKFCTARVFSAPSAHLEGSIAPDAELKFALGTSKMHTATFCQGVPEVTGWTGDSMFSQMLFKASCLVIGIVFLLPLCKILAGDTLKIHLGKLSLTKKRHGRSFLIVVSCPRVCKRRGILPVILWLFLWISFCQTKSHTDITQPIRSKYKWVC